MKKVLKATLFFSFAVALFLTSCNMRATATLPSPTSEPILTPKVVFTATSTMPPFVATRFAGATIYAPTEAALAQKAMSDCDGHPDKMWKPYEQIFSPSGLWRLAYCQYPTTGANYTKVIHAKTGDFWEVPYLDRNGKNLPEGMTGGQMKFEMWSYDEKYAYFNRYFCCLDGPNMIFSDGFGLYQLNLRNGVIAEIESGELSPDGYGVIFYDYLNHQVVNRDLKTNQAIPFQFDEQLEEVGIFKWSPDGTKVVFSAADEKWYETNSGYEMYLIDLGKNTITRILYSPPHNYYAVHWLSEKEILIEANRETGQFRLNIISGELTPIDSIALTQTPSP